jgi:hypothetical protein
MSGTWNSMPAVWSIKVGNQPYWWAEYLFFFCYRICGTIVETKSSPIPDEYQVFDTELEASIVPIEFTIDDGTATISIICPPRIRNRGDAELLKVGSIVTVIGRTQIQNGCRVVQCIGYSNLLADPPTRHGT